MGYVAVKGGTLAIEASIERLKYERLRSGLALEVDAVQAGMRALIDQVMSEASLYDPEIAALAIKQAEGSPEESVFLLRALRSTLVRKHYSLEADTARMRIERRISASFKEIPGGQILGATADYTHRLLDSDLTEESSETIRSWLAAFLSKPVNGADHSVPVELTNLPKVIAYLRKEGLLHEVPHNPEPPRDVTKHALEFPASRSERLQILARGQTGAVTALGYASLRGYGPTLHPTVGELRVGMLPVEVANPYGDPNDQDDAYYVGEIKITEVETLVPVSIPKGQGRVEIEFDIGYGISFGQNETKAIAMSLLDQCLEMGDRRYPTHDEEFVLLHVDTVEASGFISHLKLPHYVTFQSELDALRKTKRGAQTEKKGEER